MHKSNTWLVKMNDQHNSTWDNEIRKNDSKEVSLTSDGVVNMHALANFPISNQFVAKKS